MSIRVVLAPFEILLAAQAGIMRQVENLKLGRQERYGATCDHDWQINIEGALGEYALAKHLGVHWSGKGIFRDTDVGAFEVRTAGRSTYRLILHPDDRDDARFCLVTGVNGTYDIHGWILGRDGKQRKFWLDTGNGRPAFFVPQSELHEFETLARDASA